MDFIFFNVFLLIIILIFLLFIVKNYKFINKCNEIKDYLIDSDIVIWKWNINNDEIKFSGNIESLLDYKKKDLPKNMKEWKKYIHEDDYKYLLKLKNKKYKDSGESYKIKYRIKRKKFEYIWIEDKGKIFIEKNNIILKGILINIDDEKTKEINLINSSEKYLKILNQQVEAVYRWKTDGNITFANKYFCKLFEKDKNYIIDNEINTFIEEAEIQKIEEFLKKNYNKVYSDINFIINSKLEKRWFSWNHIPIYDNNNEILEIQSVGRDITEQVLKEIEIKKFMQIIENSNYGVYTFDINGKITYINKYFAEIHGYSKEELIGKNIKVLFTKTDYKKLDIKIEKILKKGSLEIEESSHVKEDGSNLAVYSGGILINNDNNLEIAFMGIEMTDIKEKELELIKEKDLSEKANKAKSEFLANMSHELRTPMNGIMGFSKLLLESEKDNDKREIYEMINYSSEHLLNIVNNILDISKIESGKLRVDYLKFDLKEIIASLEKILKNLIESKGLFFKIENQCKFDKPLIGDYIKLKQILINLLGNAIKFTEEGGVTLKIIPQVDEKTHPNDIIIEFIVEDTGIGIAKEEQEKVFEEFIQSDYFLNKRFEGTGLGLTIVKQLTDMMHGYINLESIVNKGSKFTIGLPFYVTVNSENFDENLKKEIIKKEKSIRILLAEDNLINQRLIFKMIKVKYRNAVIDIVNDGEEVIEKAVQYDYDIILMDLQMPKINGIQASELIRKSNEKIPIIAVTAYAMSEDEAMCLEAGMNGYISKPIKADVLYEMLDRFLI